MTRQLAELRHATRIVMIRHRVIRWTPLAEPQDQPSVPEWMRRGKLGRDETGRVMA